MSKNLLIVVVFVALLVGALHAAPQLFIKKNLEDSGQTFVASQFITLDDGGDSYFQFAREVYDGHFPPGDMFSKVRLPNIYPWIPPALLAIFIGIFKDTSLAYVGALFFYSAILFIGFFALGQLIFKKERLWSLVFGLMGTLTPVALLIDRAFMSISDLANIVLKNFYPLVQTPLPTLFFGRVDYPLLTHVVYLPAIIFLLMFWRNPSLRNALLAGGFAGLLFYTYFHKWAYWVIAIGVLFVLTFLFLRSDKKRLKNFLILIATIFLVSIPYFINYFKLKGLPGSADLIQRLSLELGRSLDFAVWPHYLLYAILLVLVYWFFKKDRAQALFFSSFLVAAFIVWNIQIVTGFVPHPDHWPRAINPLIFLTIFALLHHAVARLRDVWPRVKQATVLILILAAALLIAKKTVNAFAFLNPPPEILGRYSLPQDLLDSFAWLEAQAAESYVVSPSFVTTIYLTGFTAARPFLPWSGVTPLSNFEMEERFLRSNKLFGVSENVLEARLRDGKDLECLSECDKPYILSNIFGTRFFLYQLYFKDSADPEKRSIPEDKIMELLDRYRALAVDWPDLGADFVYLGPLERHFTDVDFERDRDLELVYDNASIKIYSVRGE